MAKIQHLADIAGVCLHFFRLRNILVTELRKARRRVAQSPDHRSFRTIYRLRKLIGLFDKRLRTLS